MRQSCYTRREILALTGTEEHLRTCGSCRGLFALSRDFLKGFNVETGSLGNLMTTMAREQNVRSIEEELDALPEDARLAFPRERNAIVPGLVIKLCNRSKKNLLKSPNESERWLRLAGEVVGEIKKQRLFMPQDIQWVEARYIASEGNLAMVRGFIRKAHDSFLQAQSMFAEIGDEFQAALFARGFLFTLTQMGRALEAKRGCFEALAVMRRYGASKEYLHTMINLAMMLNSISQRKRSEKILSILLRALGADDEYYNLVIHNLALVHLEDGNYAKALEYVAEMVNLNNAKKLKMEEARAYIVAGEIHILLEEYGEAKECLTRAMDLLRYGESPLDAALISVYDAKIQMAIGASEQSNDRLRDAIKYFSSEGFVPDLVDALELWEKAQKTDSAELGAIAGNVFYMARNFNRFTTEAERPS